MSKRRLGSLRVGFLNRAIASLFNGFKRLLNVVRPLGMERGGRVDQMLAVSVQVAFEGRSGGLEASRVLVQ